MAQTQQAHMGKVCDVCGSEGFHELLVLCYSCEKACEHLYGLYTFFNQYSYCMASILSCASEAWLCEACEKENGKWIDRPSKRKVHTTLLCSKKVMVEGSSYVKMHSSPSKKIKTAEWESSLKLSFPYDAGKNSGLCTGIQYVESNLQGIGLSSLSFLMLPKENDTQWRGQFVISDRGYHIYDNILAHFPGHISMKTYNALKAMPETLQLGLINRVEIWPQIFQLDPPSFHDVALYFLPSEFDRPKEKYIHLLEHMDKHDLALCGHLDGLELLIYTSKLLPMDSRKLNGELYLWGIFHHIGKKNLNQETGVSGEGSYAEAAIEIDMAVDKDMGRVDRPVVMQKGQLDDCGPASNQTGFNIRKSSTFLLKFKNNHKEQNIPHVPAGFSNPLVGYLGCRNGPLVKFALNKPTDHIGSDIPLGLSRLLHLKCGSRSFEFMGKCPTPGKCDSGDPASFASEGCVIRCSNTDKGRTYSAAAKLSVPIKAIETEEQVYLDKENDLKEESMEEEVAYEDTEEVGEVEEEEKSMVANTENAETIIDSDKEMKDGEKEKPEAEEQVYLNEKNDAEEENETKDQVCLDENNDADDEWIEEVVGYEEIEEVGEKKEVEVVEEEEESVVANGENSETTTGSDNKMKDGEEEDETEKHMELLALPPHGSQVYINNIPQNVSEDNLKSFAEAIGEVAEVKIMKRNVSSDNECCAFVTYRTEELASKAIKVLKDKEFEGKKVNVSRSKTKYKVFISNVPRNWVEDDLKKEVMKIGPGVTLVKLFKDTQNSSCNRGFAFIEYYNHACAEYSRNKLSTPQFKLGGNAPRVSWQEPRISESSSSQVKELYIKNLPKNATQDKVKNLFKHHGEITKIILPPAKPGRETRFCFVHFAERSMAIKALKNAEKYELDGQILECSLAYPSVGDKKSNSGVTAHKDALLLGHPPHVGYGLDRSYGAIPAAYGVAGFGQFMVYGRGPAFAGPITQLHDGARNSSQPHLFGSRWQWWQRR